MVRVLIVLLTITGCSTPQPPPPQDVWRYPKGLSEAQASAHRSDCLHRTAYETNLAFRLLALDECLKAKGWVKSSAAARTSTPQPATPPKSRFLPLPTLYYPDHLTNEEAEAVKVDCYKEITLGHNTEMGGAEMMGCLRAKGFTTSTLYYPAKLTEQQAQAERSDCFKLAASEPDDIKSSVVRSCLQNRGWNFEQ